MPRKSTLTQNILSLNALRKQSVITLKKPPEVKFPKRKPSVVIPPRKIVYISADKTTCATCDCFPKETPYVRKPRLLMCLQSPPTLYELASKVLDRCPLPKAFAWSVEEAAQWIEDVVGLPQYKDCIIKNNIDGMRLLMLEEPSNLPKLNIHDFDHIKAIVHQIRKEYSICFIRFARSIGLPYRKPLTYTTMFKSRTGPKDGIRQNWTRSDILRWMKILGPAPPHLDHWDLVWYQKPEFPKTMFARVARKVTLEKIPHYIKHKEVCNEYKVQRRFFIRPTAKPEKIWMEHRPGSPSRKEPIEYPVKKPPEEPKKESRLMPKKICLDGLKGKDLILARRLMPKQKFLRG